MKPSPSTYNPYFKGYIDLVQSEDLIAELERTIIESIEILNTIPSEKEEYRYDKGKWSIKELVLHCIDCERVFQYRALTYARKDTTELPGFEEDDYARNSAAEKRTLKDIIEEFKTVRMSTISLFKSFDDSVLDIIGVANGGKLSVRACGFIISGHIIHHMNILKERYL